MECGNIIPAAQYGLSQIRWTNIGLCSIFTAEFSQEWGAVLRTERDEIDSASTIVLARASAMGKRYLAIV
jgi:hypothetical protein